MLDQKTEVQKLYKDLVNDDTWIDRYKADPEKMLKEYGIAPKNQEMLRSVLRLFC